ncbi:hypothetical protein IV203_017551 [Nitzschia inconspicua]|nr:hypothetical protein IV203_017551 [Nitzschia inconspicua]
MDPQRNQSHDESSPRGNRKYSPKHWRSYVTGRGDTFDGRQNDVNFSYQYHYPPHRSYYHNPPYSRHQSHETHLEQHSGSFEDIPPPPPHYHNHGYDQLFGRNGTNPCAYMGYGIPDPNIRYGMESQSVRHEPIERHRGIFKFSPNSTMVTPIRPERSELHQPLDEFPISGSNTPPSPTATKGRLQRSPSVRRSNVAAPSRLTGELREHDVVCGRGAPTNHHSGNLFLRKLVNEYQTVYLCSKRSDKPAIAWKLLDIITSRGGRFVRRDKTHKGNWIPLNTKQAYEKLCQSLREGAPELRRRMLLDMRGSGTRGMELLLVDDRDENGVGKDRDKSQEKDSTDADKKPSPAEKRIAEGEQSSGVYPI